MQKPRYIWPHSSGQLKVLPKMIMLFSVFSSGCKGKMEKLQNWIKQYCLQRADAMVDELTECQSQHPIQSKAWQSSLTLSQHKKIQIVQSSTQGFSCGQRGRIPQLSFLHSWMVGLCCFNIIKPLEVESRIKPFDTLETRRIQDLYKHQEYCQEGIYSSLRHA